MQGRQGAVSKALSLVYFVIRPATILSSVMQDASSQAQVKLSMLSPVFCFCKTVSKAIWHLAVQRSSNSIQHPWAKHYRSWVGTSRGGCCPGSSLHSAMSPVSRCHIQLQLRSWERHSAAGSGAVSNTKRSDP